MASLSGAIDFIAPAPNQHSFNGDIMLKTEDPLVLHGAVTMGETGQPVAEVLVRIHARRADGTERLLGYTLTNDDGYYLLHVDQTKITKDTTALIVKASTTYNLSITV